MEGWNGGRGSSWGGYRRETVSSSRSGTIVSGLSTAYTSSGSRFSTFSVEAAMHFDSLEIQEELDLGIHQELHLGVHEELDGDTLDDREDAEEEEEEETREDRVRRLVQELFSARSADCSIKRDDISVVEKWVIVSPKDGSTSSGKELANEAQSWIQSLHQIAQVISFTRMHFRDATKLPIICEEQGKHVGVRCIPGPYHLTFVIQETMLKILTFVDIVVAWDPNTAEEFLSMDLVMLPPYNKLISLLGVCAVLFEASFKILTQINRSSCAEVRRIENEMTILLSAYEDKLGEAIRSTMEKIRLMSMEDGNDLSIPLNPQGSLDIHKVTRSVMTCIRFVLANYSSVNSAINGKYVRHIENIPPLDNLIIEMVSCIQGKLANISQSISDQALMSLFLLNNLYFIQDSQYFYYLGLNQQIEEHMERYLQVSWAPLLSCLGKKFPSLSECESKFQIIYTAQKELKVPDPLMGRRLRKAITDKIIPGYRKYSPLSKFESEFQKIYTIQKQWKVPDPELRRRLRQAITKGFIPRYTEYIEDNEITHPKISPQKLEATLQELFEG